MAGHSRPKDGVASLAYVPAISLGEALCSPNRDARDKRGHDVEGLVQTSWKMPSSEKQRILPSMEPAA